MNNPDRARALLALADRVCAEEPTGELRDAVLIAMGWNTDRKGVWWQPRRSLNTRNPPNPLTSRDAAAGAMPEGWRIGHMTQDEDSFCVEAYREEPDNFASAEAPDEPRARTAAALRAMAAEVGSE